MDAQTATLIGQGITTIGIIATAYYAYKAKQQTEKTAEKVTNVAQKVEEVHRATNGMKEELVAVSRSDATQIERARGLAQTTADNEATKAAFVERRRSPEHARVAVPVEVPPAVPEIHYVIRDGKLVEVIKP